MGRRVLWRAWCCGIMALGLWAGARLSPAWAAVYPAPVGRVNDFAHLLDDSAVQQLDDVLSELEARTGAEVAVVTVPSVEGGDIERAAEELFHQWGVGKRKSENGVLILCAVGDRRVRIEVGYGLERALPDAVCGRIIRERMAPHFKAGDYPAGLIDGTVAVASLIARDAGVVLHVSQPPQAAPSSSAGGLDGNVVFFLIMIALFLAMRSRRIWYGSGAWWGGDVGDPSSGWSGGGFSSDFGGFGGGSSGGDGASGSW